MERKMIIFCMLFFYFSVAQTTAPHKRTKYQQLLKTIKYLQTTVKDKDVELLHTPENPVDGCLSTSVTCFQQGILKLQPESSQVNFTFIQTVKVLQRFTISNSGKQCDSSCESYGKKTPREFLKSFAKLIQKWSPALPPPASRSGARTTYTIEDVGASQM
ncbi:interleukin-21 [Indicator indicator]|uniref:interleukin-21 n=1 Tax=Indicator indicator TaxID=1002788 RepID=UPI0023DF143A|nr:interleukin-21 [Indicator indicator]